ncbi:MAG: GTPase HflX, partial [Candidatus Omnitrophica bacterium]|nr:GTPase HflX [Candidatus Omnitrophota bacterium]
HHLIEAFKATLEEVVQADLVIHVLDAANPQIYEHNKAVLGVLKELGIGEKPLITVLNKIDLLEDKLWLGRICQDFINPVPISAKLKENISSLLEKIQENFSKRMQRLEILIPHHRMDLVDIFYRRGKVEEIRYLQKGIKVKVNLPKPLAEKILQITEVVKLQ